MSISENLQQILSSIPAHVHLVAVSKTHPVDTIMETYELGQRQFGENKVQELTSKASQMPTDVVWHMIGHLQTNKVKFIAPFVNLIHGVDSSKLLQVIDKEAKKAQRIIDCLLQIHIASETSKFGFSEDELFKFFNDDIIKSLDNVRICGLMGMATFTENNDQVRKEFRGLKQLFDKVKAVYFNDKNYFAILSMGMSDDYVIAIEEGSTLIRVGSAIFGDRDYH